MKTETFKKVDIEAAVWGEAHKSSPLVLVEVGRWRYGGRFQYQENILQDTSTGLYYSFTLTKKLNSYFPGSTYNLEWARNMIKLAQVIKTTKVVEVWVAAEGS